MADRLELARLEGARLALRSVRHALANKLTAVVGQGELLVDDPRLPPDLLDQATRLVASARAAAEVVQRLDDQLTQIRLDTTVEGPPLLDLEASTRPR